MSAALPAMERRLKPSSNQLVAEKKKKIGKSTLSRQAYRKWGLTDKIPSSNERAQELAS